jgi:UPF0755 protein
MFKKYKKKIFIVVIFVFLVSLFFIFSDLSRDRNPSKINVVVKNGTGLYSIANMLKKEDIIYSTNLFVFTSLIYGGKLIAGEYELKKNMSTLDVVRKMGRGQRNIYVLQIVEGQNIYDVAETVSKNKIMEKNEFLRLAGDKKFLQSFGITSDSLEGYLSPDTYYYSKEIDMDKFIEKIVQRTLKYF